ncbi:unnamed protein product [Cunninghamella echinulata]
MSLYSFLHRYQNLLVSGIYAVETQSIKSEDNHSYQTTIIKRKINSLNSDHGIPQEESLSIVLNVLNDGKGPIKPDTTPLTKQQ